MLGTSFKTLRKRFLHASELAMQLNNHPLAHRLRLLQSRKPITPNNAATRANGGAKLVALLPHAFHADSVVALVFSVPLIFSRRRLTQIADAIIQRVAVDVVDVLYRPAAMAVKPRKAVDANLYAENFNPVAGDLPVAVVAAHRVKVSGAAVRPSKNTRVRVVKNRFDQSGR